ncbi:MAG: cbb3-type cytochrome c oxidase subunit I [Nitrosomonas sp.]|nr:cbb3-type cytochrome c oxidase subunit I [Nitrosomonas sp.]
MTGVMVAIAPFDWQAHDAYFIVAHLHYVLIGGSVIPLFGGLYYCLYWLPARGYRPARPDCILAHVHRFQCRLFPMHISGLMGMPHRVYTYQDEISYNVLAILLSTAGAYLFALGSYVVVLDRNAFRHAARWRTQSVESQHWQLVVPARQWKLGYAVYHRSESLSTLG